MKSKIAVAHEEPELPDEGSTGKVYDHGFNFVF